MKRAAWNKINWTPQMIDFLKRNFEKMTNQELADALGLKLTTTRCKLYELGLKRMELEYWTDEQVEFLKDNYHSKGDTEIAIIFDEKYQKEKGWTKKHIEKKRRQLGLKRNERQIKKIMENHKPVYRQCAKILHAKRNVAKEGDVRVWKDGYKRIKINNRFIHLAPYLYKKHFGSIPKAMVVSFKDGNRLNCDLDNLCLKTKGQVATENQNPQKASKSIKAFYENQKIRYAAGLSSIYDNKKTIGK